jgi:hypothetical protein
MGFNLRRRIWVVIALFIYALSISNSKTGSSLYFEDLIKGLITGWVICWILNKFFVKRWIMGGIKTQKDYDKAMQYEFVRKEIRKRGGIDF